MGPAIPDSVVKDAKVLVVGAGGIGCELLKTLVLSGFENIEVIDMDTIETSNLNRQFLFRRHDVGRSKAQVAVEVVRRMRPHARIIAHHANVKDESFGIDYFRHFALVMNGLDNLDARRHVNLMCLATGVPLVESGTAGYLGQVSVHIKDMSQCFECEPKQPPKTFPICTIRNTPDKPIHCLVWAKELLFHRLFGPCEGVTDLDEDPAKAVDADKGVVANGEGEAPSASSAGGSKELAGPAPGNEGGGDAANDASAGAPKASFFHRRPDESILDFALRVCDRVYVSDIQRVLRMDDLWKGRKRPVPLPDTAALSEIYLSMAANAKPGAHTATSSLGLSKDTHKVWTLQENFCVFMEAMRLMLETRKESLFAAKGMAGNIIHAIATTNAIIAGLIVIEARKVLAKQLDACRLTYLRQFPSSKKLLIFETPPPPKPECYVCRTAYVGTELDTESSTLGTLVDKGLKARLGFRHPTITVGDSVMYEEGSDLEEEETERYVRMLPTPLAKQVPPIRNGTMLAVNDQASLLSCNLVVRHRLVGADEDPDGMALFGVASTTRAVASQAGHDSDEDDEDEILAVSDRPFRGSKDAGAEPRKRKVEEKEAAFTQATKRQKSSSSNSAAPFTDAIVLD
eukprot:jgi/Mesvir1/17625/Mv08850-RA.2